MTISASVMLFLASCFSAVPDETASKIAGEISESGMHRVGVVPRVLVRESGDDKIARELGPQAELIARDMSTALGDQVAKGAYKGKFSVASHRVMREAFGGLSVQSLGSIKALQQVGETARVDSLLVILATDRGNAIDFSYELIPVSGDTAPSVRSKSSDIKNLTDFAYMGYSFEAQRVVNDRLVPVGLKSDPNSFLPGDIPLSELKSDQPHPMTSKSFPYRIGVAVAGREAYVTPIQQELYVGLNENEKYSIQVWNTGPRPVYMALYIDGINTIGKALEGPGTTTEGRMWCLDPSSKHATISGYLTIAKPGEARQTSEEFIVARREDSLAGQLGFNDRIGLITAVIYDFIPENKATDGQKALPEIGTRAGKKEAIEIKDWGRGRRGVILAAVTLRYATPREISAMAPSGGGKPQPDPPDQAGKTSTSVAQQAFLSDLGAKRKPATAAPNGNGEQGVSAGGLEPDESVPFPREVGVASRSSSDR